MSSYSPNLRLELITTGTQAGTWGTTTNTNFGTLVEGAVSGSAAVLVTSTLQALSANNGALDESRQAILTLTSSGISAGFSVFAPPVSKQYTIYNGSSYTATIYNSTVLGNTTAAGLGVSIPSLSTVTVWSTGVSFFQQNTYLNVPVINAPAISGVSSAPTALFGNSTSQLATTAFVQAALQALYPVGCVYTSTASANPASTFGFGTWVAFAAGRVMVGVGGAFTAGATGGSADAIVVSHTHTASSGNQSADHNHTFSGTTSTASLTGTFPTATTSGGYSGVFSQNYTYSGNGSDPQPNANVSMNASHSHTVSGTTSGVSANHNHAITVDSTGASGTNANLQPYIVVYIWNRTV